LIAASGLLLVALCILHIVFGEKNYFNTKEKRGIAGYVPYHQISVVMFLEGVGMIYSAINFNMQIPVFILLLILASLTTFVVIGIKEKEEETIKDSMPQLILFGIVLLLIVLGFSQELPVTQ
jgi:succinate dehydrogenase hydrophobic anchor subunit